MKDVSEKVAVRMSASLTNAQIHAINKITEIMISSPCCSPFLKPIDPELDDVPDYFEVIKEPRDLGTIQKNIQSSKYSSWEEWEKDITLVFDNAIQYNGSKSPISSAAEAMKARLNKLIEKYQPITSKNWINTIKNLYDAITILMRRPPPYLKDYMGSDDFQNALSGQDMKGLAQAISGLTTKNDILQCIQILNYFNVPSQFKRDQLLVAVHNIPVSAANVLNKFLHEKYDDLGIEFPE